MVFLLLWVRQWNLFFSIMLCLVMQCGYNVVLQFGVRLKQYGVIRVKLVLLVLLKFGGRKLDWWWLLIGKQMYGVQNIGKFLIWRVVLVVVLKLVVGFSLMLLFFRVQVLLFGLQWVQVLFLSMMMVFLLCLVQSVLLWVWVLWIMYLVLLIWVLLLFSWIWVWLLIISMFLLCSLMLLISLLWFFS